MVHVKYTYKEGKRYGPYYYKTQRVNGKIVTTYLGSADFNSGKRTISPSVFVFLGVLALLLVFLVIAYESSLTGRVALDVRDRYVSGDLLRGYVTFILEEGELVPADSNVNLRLGSTEVSQPLSSLLSSSSISSSDGSFYAKNLELEGSGAGYGLAGTAKIYPNITFELELSSSSVSVSENQSEQTNPTSNSTDDTSSQSENVSSGNNDSTSPDNSPSSDTSSSSSGSNTEEPSSTNSDSSSDSAPIEPSSSTSPDNSPSSDSSSSQTSSSDTSSSSSSSESSSTSPSTSGGDSGDSSITGSVISEGSSIVSGQVSVNEQFEYPLDSGVTAHLVSGSVKDSNGNVLPDDSISISSSDGQVSVSTTYSETSSGYGSTFLGSKRYKLSIPLSLFKVATTNETLLIVNLTFGDVSLASTSKELVIVENASDINESVQLDLENVTNETLTNSTNLTNLGIIQLAEIPSVQLGDNRMFMLNLSEYFSGADRYEVVVSDITSSFEGSLLTLAASNEVEGVRMARIIAISDTNNESLESNEFAISVSSSKIHIQTIRQRIVIGEPVRWRKNVTISDSAPVVLELPVEAKNISVISIKEGNNSEQNISSENITPEVSTPISGAVVASVDSGFSFFGWLLNPSKGVSGHVAADLTDNSLDSDVVASAPVSTVSVNLDDNASEYSVEYYTDSPSVVEKPHLGGTTISLSASENLNYTDVVIVVPISNALKIRTVSKIKLLWVTPDAQVSPDSFKNTSDVPEETIIEEVGNDNVAEQTSEVVLDNSSEINNSSESNNSSDETVTVSNESNPEFPSLLTGNVIASESNDLNDSNISSDSNLTDSNVTNTTEAAIISTGSLPMQVPFEYNDSDGDGNIDIISWVVPHFSDQVYDIILVINANHLDENRSFISDVYPEVKALDGNWSETIPDGHYVRVTFETNLTSSNDITVYPRTLNGTPQIEVFEENKNEVIAFFDHLNDNIYNKVFLTNLNGSQNSFDLHVINGDVSFDHIVDPSISSCTTALNTADTTYTLSARLDSNTTCLNVLANNITIDCAGNTINHSISFTNQTFGINISDFNGTSILNCFIWSSNLSSNQTYGIFANNSKNIFILNTTIWSNSTNSSGIYLGNVTNVSIVNSTIITKGWAAHGIDVGRSINLSVINNTILTNGSNAFGIIFRYIPNTNISMFYNYFDMNGSGSPGVVINTGSSVGNITISHNFFTIRGLNSAAINDSVATAFVFIVNNSFKVRGGGTVASRILTASTGGINHLVFANNSGNVSNADAIGITASVNGTYYGNTINTSLGLITLTNANINLTFNSNVLKQFTGGKGISLQGFNLSFISNNLTSTGGTAGSLITINGPTNLTYLLNNTLRSQGTAQNATSIGSLSTLVRTPLANFNITGNTLITNMTNGRPFFIRQATNVTIIYNYIMSNSTNSPAIQIANVSNSTFSYNIIITNNTTSMSFYITDGSFNNIFGNNTITNTMSDIFVFRSLLNGALPRNNTITNNTLTNSLTIGYFLNISNSSINGTTLLDQYVSNYTFVPGIGSTLVVRKAGVAEVNFVNPVNGTGPNLSFNVQLNSYFAFVNSSQTGLNKTANVTFFNNQLYNPTQLYRDDVACPAGQCYNFTPLTFSTVIFNVSSWSNYTLLDTQGPNITFAPPTSANASTQTAAFINLSTNGTGTHYTFTGINSDVLLWLRMHNLNASGSPVDLSSWNNSLSATGGAIQNASGPFGRSFTFNGSSYLKGDTNPLLDLSNTSFSVSLWMYANNFSNTAVIGKVTFSGLNGWLLRLQATQGGTIEFVTANGTTANSWSPTLNLKNNTWYHVVAVYNGTDKLIYINGSLISTSSMPTGVLNATSIRFYLGSYPDNTIQFFNGSLDEVLIFNRTLKASEISSLYNATATQYSMNFSNLSNGWYNFTGYVVDGLGNRNQTAQRQINISLPTLNITINSPQNRTYTVSELPIIFNVSSSNSALYVNYTLNGGVTNLTMSSTDSLNFNATNSTIPTGGYTFKVYEWDNYGNINLTGSVVFAVRNDLISDCSNLTSGNFTYYLNQSIYTTTTPCINISQNNVTIDGQNFNITSTNSGVIAINASRRNTFKLQNISVFGFLYSVDLRSANGVSAGNLTVINSSLTGLLLNGFGAGSNGGILFSYNTSYAFNSNLTFKAGNGSTGQVQGLPGTAYFYGNYVNLSWLNLNFTKGVGTDTNLGPQPGYGSLYINFTSGFETINTGYGDNSLLAFVVTNMTNGSVYWWSSSDGEGGYVSFAIADNVSSYLQISSNFANLDSSVAASLNGPSTVTFYNMPGTFSNPAILKNDTPCTDCLNTTSLNAATVVFNVTSWSNYSIRESTNVVSCTNLTSANQIYTMTSPINASGTLSACINVTAANITLDCAGLPIRNFTAFDNGVALYSASYNTTVKNCNFTLSNRQFGMYFYRSNFSRVINDSVSRTLQGGVSFSQSYNVSIIGSTFSDAHEDDSSTTPYGISIDNGAGILITNNTIKNIHDGGDTNSYGIYLTVVNNSIITNNTIKNVSSGVGGFFVYLEVDAFHNSLSDNDINCSSDVGASTDTLGGLISVGTNNSAVNESFFECYNAANLGPNNTFANSTISNSGNAAILIGGASVTVENISVINKTAGTYDISSTGTSRNGTIFIDMPSSTASYNFGATPGTISVHKRGAGRIYFFTGVNGSGGNFTNDFQLRSNFAFVNVNSSQSGLNRSANVTFYNMPGTFSNPIILHDDTVCPLGQCYNFTSLNAATVIFNVTSWSNYSIGSNSSLNVTINFPQNRTYTANELPIRFNVSLSNNGVYVNYTLNGGITNKTMSSTDNINYNATNLSIATGGYTFQVYSTDLLGNVNNTASVVFTVRNDLISDCFNLTSANTVYYLNQSIYTTSTPCINVTQNNVTLDGQNFNLTRTSVGTIGINASRRNKFTLQNISVYGFLTSVDLRPASGTTAGNLTVINSSLTGLLLNGFGAGSNGGILFSYNTSYAFNSNLTFKAGNGSSGQAPGLPGSAYFYGNYVNLSWLNLNFTKGAIINTGVSVQGYGSLYINFTSGFETINTGYGDNSLLAFAVTNMTNGSVYWWPSFDGETSYFPIAVSDNISSYLQIKSNFANLNSSVAVSLNVPSTVTFYNMPGTFSNPAILKNDSLCTDCLNTTSLNAATVVFNVTSWSNYSIGEITSSNSPPFNITVSINSTLGSNKTDENLTCFGTLSDPNADRMNVTVYWFNGTTLDSSVEHNNSYANGTFFNASLDASRTFKLQNWSCGFRLYDGGLATYINASYNLTILNTAPYTYLVSPPDASATTNRTPIFNFTLIDPDAEPLTWLLNITLVATSTCSDNPRVVTSTSVTNATNQSIAYTLVGDLHCLYDNLDFYNWTVKVNDSQVTSAFATPRRINITSLIDLTFINDSIAFGTLTLGQNSIASYEVGSNVHPLVVSNTGNAYLNITIKSDDLWSSVTQPSRYYQFRANNYTIAENNSFLWSQSQTAFLNVSASGSSAMCFVALNYTDSTDSGAIDFNITVPESEISGFHRVNVTLIGSLGE